MLQVDGLHTVLCAICNVDEQRRSRRQRCSRLLAPLHRFPPPTPHPPPPGRPCERRSSERRGSRRLSDLPEGAPLVAEDLGAMLPVVGEEEPFVEEQGGSRPKRRRTVGNVLRRPGGGRLGHVLVSFD